MFTLISLFLTLLLSPSRFGHRQTVIDRCFVASYTGRTYYAADYPPYTPIVVVPVSTYLFIMGANLYHPPECTLPLLLFRRNEEALSISSITDGQSIERSETMLGR